MKKAIVLLLALVAIGGFVFAADAPAPTYEFSANASAKWQYDLDTNLSGFTNSWDLSLKYHLLNNLAPSTGGEGTYGLIEVTHLNLNMLSKAEDGVGDRGFGSDAASWGDGADDGKGDNLAVAAKIVMNSFSIGLGYGAYTAGYENAMYVPLFSEDAGYDNDSAFKPKLSPGGSIKLGYALGDMGSVSAVIGSNAAGAANKSDEYTFGFDAALTPVKDVLALNAGAWYNLKTEMWVATAKVALTAGDLTAYGAMDLAKDDTASVITVASGTTDLAFDAAGGVAYSLNEKKDSINFDAYYTKSVGTADADPVPAYNMHQGDIGFKFVDAEGFVPGLSFTLGVFADDLAGDAPDTLLSVAGSGSYKVALSDATYAKPYFETRKDMAGAKDLYVKAGVEAKLFANTVLDANLKMKTTSDDLNHALAADANNVLTVSAKITL